MFTLRLVPRLEWSGVKNKGVPDWPIRPATKVFYQNTLTPPCPNDLFCQGALRQMQLSYKTKFSNDIKYNFMIGGDGTVYEGRGWKISPFVPKEYTDESRKSISIAFIGYYKKETLPEGMINSAQNLIKMGIQYGYISQTYQEADLMTSKPPQRFIPS